MLGDFDGAPSVDWSNAIGSDGSLPTSLAGVMADVGGNACVLSYVSPDRVDLLLPGNLNFGPQTLRLTWPGGASTFGIAIAPSAPEFLAEARNGKLYAAVLPGAAVFAGRRRSDCTVAGGSACGRASDPPVLWRVSLSRADRVGGGGWQLRGVLVLLAFSVRLGAQFDHLVTNDEGTVLYFSSSLRMRGTQQLEYRKLFVADAQGIRLHTERERQQINVPESTWPVSTYYSIEGAAVNGDGSVMGVIARRDCYAGSGCLPVPKYHTEIAGGELRGRASLSRNGRFALLSGDGSMVSLGALVDLSTGQRREWLETFAWTRYGRRRVTSGGTALLGGPEGLQLMRLNGSTSLPVPDRPFDAVIDDEGKAAVYEAAQADGNGRKLVHVDLASGAVRLLATAAADMWPCLSNDGQVVLFLSAGQIFVMRADGTGLRRLTQDPSGITEAVLSGNGRVAYAVSSAGRLFRVDLESGATQQVIGRSMSLVALSDSPPYPVPGSAFAVEGRGFADSVESVGPPLPLSLNGVELLLDGRPLPLQSVAPTRVAFQLPWDIAPGTHRLEARTDVDAVFEAETIDLEIRHEAFAQFELLPDGFRRSVSGQPYALAVHGDWNGLITAENRARPGEVIHLYMTGLGPVAPAVETGAPSPAEPPARVVLPLACSPAEVLFAGLAPGFAGYYQVTLRIPGDVSILNGDALFSCSFAERGSGTSAWIPVRQ